jgi:hypothetical protein
MPRAITVEQIESVKDRINFDRRFISHYFSGEVLRNEAVVDELVASTRAEVNPNLVKWVKNGKTPHELLVGPRVGGGTTLNPRQDIFSLIEELWLGCMELIADQKEKDKKKVRKSVNQGKRTAIAALQNNKVLADHIIKDRDRK